MADRSTPKTEPINPAALGYKPASGTPPASGSDSWSCDGMTLEEYENFKFFRQRLFQIKGFGFAFLFVVGSIALNGEPGSRFGLFNLDEIARLYLDNPQETRLDAYVEDIRDRTVIFLSFIIAIGLSWACYCISMRNKLPAKHPTLRPKWVTVAYCLFIMASLSFIGWRLADSDSSFLQNIYQIFIFGDQEG